jgi:hypothetical protein
LFHNPIGTATTLPMKQALGKITQSAIAAVVGDVGQIAHSD